jgi:hypothetical protein
MWGGIFSFLEEVERGGNPPPCDTFFPLCECNPPCKESVKCRERGNNISSRGYKAKTTGEGLCIFYTLTAASAVPPPPPVQGEIVASTTVVRWSCLEESAEKLINNAA